MATIKRDVPTRPGVYLFHNGQGEIIYIGKSVNLRLRLLSYFRQDLVDLEPRLGHLVFEITDFTWHQTESELLALLWEDDLIKRYLPRYNIRQKEYAEYRYLVLTEDAFPTLLMTDSAGAQGPDPEGPGSKRNGQVFGPLRDRYLAEDVQQLVQRHLRLRSCTDTTPTDKCLNYEIGHCRGPCREAITPRAYARSVTDAVAFLRGDESRVVRKLQEARDRHSHSLAFERAEELEAQIAFCRRFCERQRFYQHFQIEPLTVIERGRKGLAYVFVGGQLVVHGRVESVQAEAFRFIGAYTRRPQADARFLLDRANIVYNWIRRNAEACEYRFGKSEASSTG